MHWLIVPMWLPAMNEAWKEDSLILIIPLTKEEVVVWKEGMTMAN